MRSGFTTSASQIWKVIYLSGSLRLCELAIPNTCDAPRVLVEPTALFTSLGDLTFFWSHHHPGGLVTTREVKGFPRTLEAFPLLSHAFNCQRGRLFTFVFGDVTVQPGAVPHNKPSKWHALPRSPWAVVGLEIATVRYFHPYVSLPNLC